MSKQIKQMEMQALSETFKGVRDMVMMSVTGLNSQEDNRIRLDLRKKNIRLQVVKNSLARRVFGQMGMNIANTWAGPTTIAWGSSSIAELSQELEQLRKKNDKFKPKGAVVEGQEISFEQALKMPTRAQAIGRVVALALAPAGRLVSQILGPAGQVAGQIKSLKDRGEGEAAAPAEAPG